MPPLAAPKRRSKDPTANRYVPSLFRQCRVKEEWCGGLQPKTVLLRLLFPSPANRFLVRFSQAREGDPMRFLHGLPAVLSMASVLFCCIPLAPEYGSCPVCCSLYPSGWRGMCVRRCTSDRQRFPRAERRFMRCECNFDRLGAWSCRGRY